MIKKKKDLKENFGKMEFRLMLAGLGILFIGGMTLIIKSDGDVRLVGVGLFLIVIPLYVLLVVCCGILFGKVPMCNDHDYKTEEKRGEK